MNLDDFLLKYSKFIDNNDLYLGPFSSFFKESGDDLLGSIGFGIKCVDISMKVPFLFMYTFKTKDFSAVPYLVTKEFLAATIPYGGLLEIFRSYEKVVKNEYKNKNKKDK